jgi:hypothetical protein
MNPRLKPSTLALLAGIIASTVLGCSRDFPTVPNGQPSAGGSEVAQLNKNRPANDDFSAALAIGTIPFTNRVNTSNATAERSDPLNDETCGFGSIGGHTVWYQFTPTQDLRINVSTVGSDFDPNVFAYTGSRGNLTRVACNFLPQSMTFLAEAGQTYFILAGSSNGDPGGNLVLSVDLSLEVSVTIDPVGQVNPSTGVATITGTVTCSRPAFFELGGEVQQRNAIASQGSLFASSDCDGVTPWEGEVTAETGKFVPGTAQVSASALFTANATTEERQAERVSATVRLNSTN